jgi:hypothetical protein
MRCTNPEQMLHVASLALHVPTETELAATRRRYARAGKTFPEYPYESEAAHATRRFRVFTLTAAQPVLNRVNNAVCHAAAEVGWRVAEGRASAEEIAASNLALRAEYEAAVEVARAHFVTPAEACVLPRLINVLVLLVNAPDGAARNLVVPQPFFASGVPVPLLTPEETNRCCSLIREIFGLHRGAKMPPYWQPTWVTGTVLSLARQMYESRDFGAMPILADALQDAGCDNEDVLSHCRDSKQVHVRGCWVVDWVLGKG